MQQGNLKRLQQQVHQIFVIDASSRPLAMVTQAQLVHALL
jgi:CBS-domain-containing membrane protein